MSAYTVEEVAEFARTRMNLPAQDTSRLVLLVPSAITSLAIKIARRADWEALRAEVAVNCINGVITLAEPKILTEVLLETGELILDNKFVKPAPSYQELTLKLPADVRRWSLKTPTKIHVTELVTGALGTVNQTGTLTYNVNPSLAELPSNYDKELIDEMVTLSGGRVEKPPKPKLVNDDEGVSLNLNAT